MTDLLRNEMQFKGIIISDAMDMRGVLDQYGAVDAVKRAVEAGVDVLIQPLNIPQTIDAVVAGVTEGRYTEARLDSVGPENSGGQGRLGLGQNKLVDISRLRFVVGDSSNVADRATDGREIDHAREGFAEADPAERARRSSSVDNPGASGRPSRRQRIQYRAAE